MIDPQASPKSYLRLLAFVIVLGLVSALITFTFMALVHQGTSLVWTEAAQALGIAPPLFTILVCTFGGLLVGLLVKFFGDHSGIFAELMLEFGKTGRFNYRHAPGIVITAFVSLISAPAWDLKRHWRTPAGGWEPLLRTNLSSMKRRHAHWAIPASVECWLPSLQTQSAVHCWGWNRRKAGPLASRHISGSCFPAC